MSNKSNTKAAGLTFGPAISIEEQRRDFAQHNPVNKNFWEKMSDLTILQATLYMLDIDPGAIQAYLNTYAEPVSTDELPEEFLNRLSIVKSAVRVGLVERVVAGNPSGEVDNNTRIVAASFLKWRQANDYCISGHPCNAFFATDKLTADEVSIAFVGDKNESGMGANNMLEISARGEIKRVPLSKFDMVDRRKGELNSQGAILLGFAHKKKLLRSEKNAAQMTRLRKLLRKHLGISDDPFTKYNKSTGWLPLFKITDKRGAADERAKLKAERCTISYEGVSECIAQQFDDTNNTHGAFDTENDSAADWLKVHDPNAAA